MSIVFVGIDLAKNVFAVHGIDEHGFAVSSSQPWASLGTWHASLPTQASRCRLLTSMPALGRTSPLATPPCGCMFMIDNCSGYAVAGNGPLR
jgi:hypothetical protein